MAGHAVGLAAAIDLNGTRRAYLGAQASLPARSALARKIETARLLKMAQSTQRDL
jgi:hypothetical protein